MKSLGMRLYSIPAALVVIMVLEFESSAVCDENISPTHSSARVLNSSEAVSKFCPTKDLAFLGKDGKQLVPNEDQVARDGHFSGFRPLIYSVQLKLMNFENFTASVTILIESVEPTAAVILNFDSKALKVNPNDIRLKMLKSTMKESSPIAGLFYAENIEHEFCFNKTLKSVEKERLLIMDIQETAPAGRLFLLEISNYSGNVFDERAVFHMAENAPATSEGLRRTERGLSSAALSTIFQMRLARTVLPCFDHPSLKANFSVCIEHSNTTIAMSNMAAESREDKYSSVIDCFKISPKIPTYVFTFSILENFTSVIDIKGSTSIEVYFPANEPASRYIWEKEYVSRTLAYIKQTFDLTPNIDRFAFLNLRPCAFWGIENYGLISADASQLMDNRKELGRVILVHEIVHQWLGNDVTVSNWDEICLQEGLTAYLEGSISNDLNFTAPLNMGVALAVSRLLDSYNNRVLRTPIKKFNVTQDIADHCFGYPFAVFYMMREAYGEDLWISFLKKLLQHHHFGNANFAQWIKILNEIRPVSPNNAIPAGEFLQNWFTQDGYPVSYVRINGHRINIVQKVVYGKEDWSPERYVGDSSAVRPIPYAVLMENDGESIERNIVVDSLNFTFEFSSKKPKWIVLDSAGITPTRIFYEPEIYLGVIECVKVRWNCSIDGDRFNRIFDDFCFAFFQKKIQPKLNGIWDNLLKAMRDFSQENRSCHCCNELQALNEDAQDYDDSYDEAT